MAKPKVLFLCTGNSCRSQMAEGWTRHLKGDVIDVSSAGLDPRGLDPLAVQVMGEVGVDIGSQRSKHVNDLRFVVFDLVITACDRAMENCPTFFSLAKRLHVGFDDPPELARAVGNMGEVLGHYRRVRDEIRAFVERLPEILSESKRGGKP